MRQPAFRKPISPKPWALRAKTIGLIEAGGYNPTLNLCVAICKTLHVTLNDLFWEDDGDINTNPFFF